MITFKGRQIPETLAEIVDPKHTALIIHELLNDFCAAGGTLDKWGRRIDATKVLPPTVKLLDAARKKNVKVMYVRYTNYADYSNVNDPLVLQRWETIKDPSKKGYPVPGTWGWENLSEVAPIEDEAIVPKLRVDCFEQTNLDMLLRASGIRTFIIVGIGSEVGIVPTASTGMSLGYFVVAPVDCVGPTNPAKGELANKFISRYAWMNPSSEILKAWGV